MALKLNEIGKKRTKERASYKGTCLLLSLRMFLTELYISYCDQA